MLRRRWRREIYIIVAEVNQRHGAPLSEEQPYASQYWLMHLQRARVSHTNQLF